MLRREIRNSNIEARNKSETRMTKETLRPALAVAVFFPPFDIRIRFGFRNSDFGFSEAGCPTDSADLEPRERKYRWS
jgi:hypothetical protein